MRVLDRYITRVFLSTFFVVLLFILGIFVVVSVFSVIDSLLEAKVELAERGHGVVEILVEYYAVTLPSFLLRLLPFITFIAATIALIRLLRGNEIAPMISSGRSPDRIVLPIYVLATLTSLLMLAAQEWLIPRLAEDRTRLELLTEGNLEGEVDDIPPMTDSRGNTWHIEFYYPLDRVIEKVESVRYRSGESGEYAGTLAIDRAVWREDGAGGAGWYPVSGMLLPAAGGEELLPVVPIATDRPLETDLTPTAIELELAREHREAGKMLSLTEAARMVREYPDLPRQRVAFHSLITWPIANSLILLLGLPFIFGLGEKNLFVGIGISLLICGGYFVVDMICQDLGSRVVLPPTMATWLPVAFFLSLTVAVRSAIR